MFKECVNIFRDAVFGFLKESTFLPLLLVMMSVLYFSAFIYICLLPSESNNVPQLIVFITTGYSAWLTFVFSQTQASRNLRRNHTLTMLIQSREAPNYQQNIRRFHLIWTTLSDRPGITFNMYTSWREGKAPEETCDSEKEIDAILEGLQEYSSTHKSVARREVSEAVSQLLNYYEFLSAGITKRVFDEKILKETIRGIFCNFVFCTQDIIENIRSSSIIEGESKSLENLVYIYYRWETNQERKKIIRLGPPVPDSIVNTGFLHGLCVKKIISFQDVLKNPL